MSFFSSDPDQQSPRQEPPARPLFQQPFTSGGTPESHVSLSAYISKHFQEDKPQETEAVSTPSRFIAPAGPSAYNLEDAAGKQGHFLNQVDVEFVAGLEQYMPTPLFRLRVTKKRLDIEIGELKMRLNKYEKLLSAAGPSAADDLRERMTHLRERIAILERHEREVSLELQALLTYGPTFYTMAKGIQKVQNMADGLFSALQTGLKKALFGEKKLQIESKGQELRTLQEVLSERMADKNTSATEISQLINQYEQAIREMEQLTAHLQQGSGFRQFVR